MISRGDIYYADLSPVIGSEQGGIRPVLVLQNNKGNKFSTTVIVAPISSKLTKNPIPTHVIIRCDSLEKKSVILLEQINFQQLLLLLRFRQNSPKILFPRMSLFVVIL